MSSQKQLSGNEKLKKRRRIEQLVKSQKGAIDKFVLIKSNTENNYHLKNENNKDNDNDALRQDEAHSQEQELNIINSNSVDESDKNVDVDLGDDNNKQSSESIHVNIFYPKLWDGLDQKFIDILVVKGPKRDLSIETGPKDDVSRCFTLTFWWHCWLTIS